MHEEINLCDLKKTLQKNFKFRYKKIHFGALIMLSEKKNWGPKTHFLLQNKISKLYYIPL